MTEIAFPPGFRFGAATAAYQIEGAWDADGKGPSVWDTLTHLADGATGDVACDHYHRVDEDIELMAALGIDAYRFSVSWPRAQPDGRGAWNTRGLAFYDRLVDALLARGIEPTLTLYHWDHPQALEDDGGWMNRETSMRFADYAAGMAVRFGDRVERWITLNEPLSVLTGNVLGFMRPSGALGKAGLAAAHHLLLAHGLAVQALRAAGVRGELGVSLSLAGIELGSDDPLDVVAARRAEVYEDRLFVDPLLLGAYPLIDGRPVIDSNDDDLEVIAAPIDFLGVNWYAPARIVDPSSPDVITDGLFAAQAELFGYARAAYAEAPTSLIGWPVLPERLGSLFSWLRTNYANLPPVYITENGIPLADEVDATGAVHDPQRIGYMRRCLAEVRAAVDAGMDIRGYYAWSLMDNLEWGLGYEPRFGLVHVDFDTLVRTPKDSYYWYRDLIGARSRQAEVATV